MSLIAMDMPETHAELVDWLEQQLVGLDLAALVAELSAIHGSGTPQRPDATSMVNLLGGKIPEVIECGLTVLDTAQIRGLLRHPRTLLELQELVLTAGGTHWDKRMEDTANNEFQRIADTGWRRMKLAIAPPVGASGGQIRPASAGDTISSSSPTEVALPTLKPENPSGQHAPARRKSVWPSVLATAALLMVGAFGLYQTGLLSVNVPRGAKIAQNDPAPPEPAASKWGWERPGAIPTGVSAPEYLTTLAHAADEWFNKRPDDAASLEKRITAFRNGCSVLIEAPHEPLAPADREWLVEKCKAWRDKLDSHLAALKAGEDPLSVRQAADETIGKLKEAMRARADEIA